MPSSVLALFNCLVACLLVHMHCSIMQSVQISGRILLKVLIGRFIKQLQVFAACFRMV